MPKVKRHQHHIRKAKGRRRRIMDPSLLYLHPTKGYRVDHRIRKDKLVSLMELLR